MTKAFHNTFSISAAKLLSASKVLKDDLLFLGYFFFNSHYDTLEITEIERFGNSVQILEAIDRVVSAGMYYSRGYYDRDHHTREQHSNQLTAATRVSASDHDLIIRINKTSAAGSTNVGVFGHISFDIRFLPKNPKPTAVGRDYDIYHTRPNEPFYFDKNFSYIVSSGTCFETADLKRIRRSFNDKFLPDPFSFADNDAGNILVTDRMNEYFAYLSLMGSSLKGGVIRFAEGKTYKLSPLFMEFSAEALKAGIATTGVVKASDLRFAVQANLIERFGISFAYDEFGFPNGINIATKEFFFVEGRNEPGWRVDKNYFALEAI